jgi:hypothetical protein
MECSLGRISLILEALGHSAVLSATPDLPQLWRAPIVAYGHEGEHTGSIGLVFL